MNIAVLTSSYPRFQGDGTAPFVQSICEGLVKLGHAVEVVAPYDPAVQPGESGSVRVHRFRYTWPERLHIMGHARSLEADVRLKPLAYLLLPFFLAAALYTLLRVTARQQSQAIHAHWVLPNGLVAAWAASWRGLPFVVSLHGSDMYLAGRSKLFGAAARYVFSRAAAVTACSPELHQAALALGAPGETMLLPWGADPDQFHPGLHREETRETYGAGPEDVLIVGLGRLVHKKGFDRLLEALPAVLAGQPRVRLVLGGEGPLQENLARRAAGLGVGDHVSFPGRVPWDCVPELLAAADIFVLPSVRDERGNVDGLPTVLLEAMGSGTALVASDIGGVSLVVDHGQTGLLVPPGNVQALSEAILSLAGDPAHRRALGQAARRAVVERFNWVNVAGHVAGLLEGTRKDTALDSGEGQRDTAVTDKDPSPIPSIPPETYTRAYYETCCQGHEEFSDSGGKRLPLRLSIPLELAGVQAGMQVVDIGCGRGEILLHSAQRGAFAWGLDYAREAVVLTRELLQASAGPQEQEGIGVQQANATQLPFASEKADLVFMLDVVEHLYPAELKAALDEAWRILRPGGRLVVHTMPNLWYYRFGYPVYRGMQRLRGERLPADPRLRWAFRHVHVNEQTPASLRQALKASRFEARVWLASTQSYEYEANPLVRRGMYLLASARPFKWAFCNDIFAIGTKSER